MKKNQLLAGAFVIASSLFAQKAELSKNNFVTKTNKKITTTPTAHKSAAIWSDDFSDANTWTLGHASSCNLDWEIGQNLSNSGEYITAPVASTTAANGFAMLDSDAYGAANPGDVESSWMTTASPINLSGNTSVLLSFETNYRQFDTQCFIVTSTNNTDWPDLNVDFDASTNPNVYALWEDFGNNDELESNPTTVNVNISGSAGGQSQVWVRFHHTGTWGYSWFVDDASINNLQANDIVLNEAWASTFFNSEYGRTPISQLSDSLALGGEIFNFGSSTQTGIELSIAIKNSAGATMASNVESFPSLEQDSTDLLQTAVAVDLAEGVYTLNATLTSDADNANGDYFGNNTYTREFAISKNIFSLDGIGVYDEEDLSVTSLGTGNTGVGEGNTLFARYVILEETSITGLEVAISSQSTVGGQIFSFLLPESSLINEDGSLNQSADVYSGRIAENEDGVTVTQNNIDNNLVYIPLPETTLAPGVYYACAELYTAGGSGDALQVLDDETVWEPYYASLYFTADDQKVYTNGTAIAIRMALGDYVDLDENENNTLFSVVPNPSNGVFTVTTDKNDFYTLDVVNILGEVISSKTIEGAINETIDISSFDAGIYLVKVTTSTSQNVQRVVIK
ncbi:MAG: T9SS type A sorting domain-containing protein [Flavobacteriales bacterium]|nr:T9SS type A sorting domain-containing protein [Flavobacteriales bacterium]